MVRDLVRNPDARSSTGSFRAPTREPLAVHRRLPNYAPTPLVDAPALAGRLGVGKLWVKDESNRLGLPSFKMLGASWATYRALGAHFGIDPEPWADVQELAAKFAPYRPLALAAATDGNHGRAVAHVAALLGLEARIFVPVGTATARIEAIEAEGASCTIVAGTYDDVVRRSAVEAGSHCLLISDTSVPGTQDVPAWVGEGYSTIFWEVDEQLAERDLGEPDLVVSQIGVGALASAAVLHYRRPELSPTPAIVGVEPLAAACVLASARAGRVVSVPGPHDSIMAGLNCDIPSEIAWPIVSKGIDLFVAIEDDRAREAMRELAVAGVVAGETGAAGLGCLDEILTGPEAEELREFLGLGPQASVLVLCTEGATDPGAYEQIVGTRPEDVVRAS